MTAGDVDEYLRRLMANLPEEILEQGRFLVWEGRPRPSGRVGKVPVTPSSTGGWCAVNASDDRHWLTWEQATRQFGFHDAAGGLALVLSGSDLIAIDLDDCVTWGHGEPIIGPQAVQVLRALGWPGVGHLELSPSGLGLHLIGRGVLDAGPRKHAGTELLDAGIVTLTGQALLGEGDLAFPDGVLAALQGSWVTPAVRPSLVPSRNRVPPQRTDTQLLNRARHSRNGAKFRRLFDFGDTISDYPSRSEGVAGLIAMLLYWCDADLARAERLYRQSSLYRSALDDRPASADGRTRLQFTLDRVSNWRRRS